MGWGGSQGRGLTAEPPGALWAGELSCFPEDSQDRSQKAFGVPPASGQSEQMLTSPTSVFALPEFGS